MTKPRKSVVAALAVIVVLIGVVLAPAALQERPAHGAVVDTGRLLRGQVQAASEGLRRLGYTCSDLRMPQGFAKRSCDRVRMLRSSQVHIIATEKTGVIQRVDSMIEQEPDNRAGHRQVLAIIVDALGLPPADRTAALAARGTHRQPLRLAWGTLTVRSGGSSSVLRAENHTKTPAPVTTALAASLDELQSAASTLGYACTRNAITAVCSRSNAGYDYDLVMRGTATYVVHVDLDVVSTFRTRTRTAWLDDLSALLTSLDTEQSRGLVAWLSRSRDAPGARSWVEGLGVGFQVRDREYQKETMGGVSAVCPWKVDDLSPCAPELS
ncbi:MAG TPA: hypothetical protein VF642_09730 [Propionibacteriaceae bacterium]